MSLVISRGPYRALLVRSLAPITNYCKFGDRVGLSFRPNATQTKLACWLDVAVTALVESRRSEPADMRISRASPAIVRQPSRAFCALAT